MKILLLSGKKLPESGNRVELKRISKGLIKAGHNVLIKTSSDYLNNSLEIEEFKPDIVHGFHLYKAKAAKRIAEEHNAKLIMSLTGTDYNVNILEFDKQKEILEVIKSSNNLIICSQDGKDEVITQIKKNVDLEKNKIDLDEIKKKIVIIKKGVGEYSKEKIIPFKMEQDVFVFTLIAGIRPIKQNIYPIVLLEKLILEFPQIRLKFVGPELDEAYTKKFKRKIKDKRWIEYVGVIPHKHIDCVYEHTDVILNCSEAEGQSEVINEALDFGNLLLVSDNSGNRSLVKDQKNGLVYRNEQDFIKKAKALISNSKLRDRLIKKSEEIFEFNDHEIEDYLNIYSK